MEKQRKIKQGDYVKAGTPFEAYIRESDHILRADEAIIVHLDGIKFTGKYCKKMSSPNKIALLKALALAAKRICEEIPSVRIAYACGDEVSIVINGKEVIENDYNRINKLLSKTVSILTLAFYKELLSLKDQVFDELKDNAFFSGKIYNVPYSKVDAYLKWRLLGGKKLVFDKRENFEQASKEEKYGILITWNDGRWALESVDFEDKKIGRSPQSEYYSIY